MVQAQMLQDSFSLFGCDMPFPCHPLSLAETHAMLVEYIPACDPYYQFDPTVTAAIVAGLSCHKKTLIYGPHGTGKSSHIEQVAARLAWPTLRVNLDGHLTRMDLVGKESIVLKDAQQVTLFQEGLLPWAMHRPILLVLDEYDAARPDLLFILQRLLEAESRLTLFETGEIITPHPDFRLMATANTIGTDDANHHYAGTHVINPAQLDRWQLIASLEYLSFEREKCWIQAKISASAIREGAAGVRVGNPHPLPEATLDAMLRLAHLTRQGVLAGDLTLAMSPRTVLAWGENHVIFQDLSLALRFSYLNRLEKNEQKVLAEYYQRCFAEEISLDLRGGTAEIRDSR